jgi:phage-related protein
MTRKPLVWIGSALEDLRSFPEAVKDEMGSALDRVQLGRRPPQAKILKGFGGGAVLELIADHDGDTYRGVYTVRYEEAVYVLHCFQKKSHKGGAVPKRDREMIERRLKAAEEIRRRRTAG